MAPFFAGVGGTGQGSGIFAVDEGGERVAAGIDLFVEAAHGFEIFGL